MWRQKNSRKKKKGGGNFGALSWSKGRGVKENKGRERLSLCNQPFQTGQRRRESKERKNAEGKEHSSGHFGVAKGVSWFKTHSTTVARANEKNATDL